MEILTKIEELKRSYDSGKYTVVGKDVFGGFVKSFLSYKEALLFIKLNSPRPVTFDKPLSPVNDFDKICSSLAKVLTEKNKRYGNSALNPIEVFNGKSKVGQRADDKLSRIKNNTALRKNDVCDLIGYLILICKENNWIEFEDQID